MNEEIPTSRLGKLSEAWSLRAEQQVGDWVQNVSQAYFNCDLSLVAAAELLGAQPAELQAALVLASMDEDDLEVVSRFNPPITTWFFIAECPRNNLVALMEGINTVSGDQSTAERAQALVRGFMGPSLSESIATLDSTIYTHLAKKAEQYKALNDKHRQALKGFGARIKRGQSLSPKQIAYAEGLLQQLVELGVISRKTPDGDSEMMETVLHALGRD